MPEPLLVIKNHPLLDALFCNFQGYVDGLMSDRGEVSRCCFDSQLQGIEQGTGISVRNIDQGGARASSWTRQKAKNDQYLGGYIARHDKYLYRHRLKIMSGHIRKKSPQKAQSRANIPTRRISFLTTRF